MGRSKKLTKCWDEILKLCVGAGALRWLFTSTGSTDAVVWLGWPVWFSAIPSQRCCGHSCWVVFQESPSQAPCNPVSSSASDEERAHKRSKWKRARHPKPQLFFSSNICRRKVVRAWGTRYLLLTYCSHYIKIQIGWCNIPSITALHWYFYNS